LFKGIDKIHLHNHTTIKVHLPLAVHAVLEFIKKHSSIEANIQGAERIDRPRYAIIAAREVVTNVIVHADYSIEGYLSM
jgi:predicted HTH transcriptional regulator